MIFLEDLIHKASEFYYLRQQIDMLLVSCTTRIRELFALIRHSNIENADKIFIELFEIQRTLSTIKFKYLFEFDDFLNDFIYFFDRQDDCNRLFLYEHFSQHDDLPK
ncbi:hypothetical protein V6667_05905 [Neisseria leonii]|uniref:Uncharacterized protein n=1 Tax=Neisseria leonii TaxID=2995413 RepID=A0A9X4IE51_9NEIS|nr:MULTISPECIES: hypothetical protein [unclassified Neisseria]MDD9326227.1 hypothetical protein [Neisseria sp. 3986]MDD9327808.1 hypothetical protein [Neisseria sp. 51.81]